MNDTPSPKVDMSKIENPNVARVFDSYPEAMRVKMMRLRQLVPVPCVFDKDKK